MSSNTSLLAYNLLHMEIVKYHTSCVESINKKKKEWSLKNNGELDVCGILKQDDPVISQLFTQGSVETRLELMGFRIGQTICEKVSKDTNRLSSSLEIMKFICKEFWLFIFSKQADNLKTNNQGIFVIFDNKFSLLMNFSHGKRFVSKSGYYLALPSGIIRGALHSLNVKAIVTASTELIPGAKFQIHLQPN
ncbi:Transport protein particle (TRAPP) component family and NO signalling/Golgi transport ligand-binding domain-containing protein [Strongyloides ratti]|uniref:Transport protein particle (TRAPP) component family and NO signalling/Golgi transport ligand-binding domain-containing protein n=1 Tax=Strongyloides ratti TaxID=34506 RepID=A0A090L3J6_STRRB|nr:Transport protein particle (TRAPP) component family and NO signalling/Golgi transport ligand-binding domain-containing protein [Strongyloides ratti]CEF64277.1 Transport protein particle (TRAPP) component family and NO signalling/Golgi transport ligand-binding domain-containing protein [Strongyloides ratti]